MPDALALSVLAAAALLFAVMAAVWATALRIHNAGIYDRGVAAIPVSQIRPGSVRSLGDRGPLIVSKWLARRRGWPMKVSACTP